jgi:multidrug transporter EmrE-like cation transporter
MHLLLVFGTVLLTVYGQLIIKHRALAHASVGSNQRPAFEYVLYMLLDPWVLSGLGAAVLASVLWVLAMQKLELGFAYPFVALSFALVPIAAYLLLDERLPPLQLLGIAMIIAGVTVSAAAR